MWNFVFDRSTNIESSLKNHALMADGRERGRLSELEMPTLVIHGDEDPMFPAEHGVALAAEIPGARLLMLEHTGHELPRRVWDEVVPAILEVTTSRR
jgi:pimeloyl-ACP methyl ester carboxylesterase